MKGIDIIRNAVELTLISGQLEDEQPGSLLITAQVEEGKTHLVSRYASLPTVAFLADATAYGIVQAYKSQLLGGTLRTLILPELIRPLERQKETASSFVAFLAELMEEGIKEIQTYATSFRLPVPVKAGVIACIARGPFEHRVRYWNESGFLSRFLVISYGYSKETADTVRRAILERETRQPEMLTLPPKGKVVLPMPAAERLAQLAVPLAQGVYQPLHGFRMQKHLQRLAMASALREERGIVAAKDLEAVEQIAKYVNLQYAEI